MSSTTLRSSSRASVLFALLVLAIALSLALPERASAMGSSKTAAAQVALRSKGLYGGTIDGIRGPATVRAIRTLQRRAGLTVDGIVGPATQRAMGRLGRPAFGSRVLTTGMVGWDVSQLQFLLAWHGFPSGTIDGGFGARTGRAVRGFQAYARLGADGAAGPATLAALRRALPRSPLRLARPSGAAVGDRFGPRGNRFHAGVDFTASYGAHVRAARSGRVFFAGWDTGGFGYLVKIAHGYGVTTLYAHLSRIRVSSGQRVGTGSVIGNVGSTGYSTGPHLHFEVHLRGAAVNPLTALG